MTAPDHRRRRQKISCIDGGIHTWPYGIVERAGWHCVTCNRGPFHVIEVWVENDTMVEVLPPDFAAEYLAWTRPDTVATRMTSAPSSGARHARARSA